MYDTIFTDDGSSRPPYKPTAARDGERLSSSLSGRAASARAAPKASSIGGVCVVSSSSAATSSVITESLGVSGRVLAVWGGRHLLLADGKGHVSRINRELAVNAIRHGDATSVRIAGTIDGDRLLGSVTDNGKGFDPDLAPGVLQGHFGLQGIRERLEKLGGEFTIDSILGKGSKAVFTIPVPKEEQG